MPCLGQWYLVVRKQIIMPPPMLQNVTTGSVQDLPAPTKPNNNPLSVFLIITAKAYSSIGFGLSVLAIWIRWFIPGSQKDVTQPSPVQAKAIAAKVPARRHKKLHSNPHVPQISRPTPLRRASAPPDSSHLVPIFRQGNEQIPDDTNRRVCFADAPNTPSRRNTSPLQRSQTLPELEEEEADPSPPPTATFVHLLTESPPASAVVSIEPALVQLSPPMTPEAVDVVETNGNSNSPSSTPRQRKLKLGFTLMNRRSGADKESPSLPESTTKATRKSSYPFPWTNSRKLSSESATSVEASSSSKASSSKSSSPCPSAASLPSMLQKKSYRRASAPASRTSPYEAPYFATPPLVLDDSYSHYLRKLPQFDDEVASNPSHSRSSTDRPSSSSGISRKIQRPPPKRRPASVGGWEE